VHRLIGAKRQVIPAQAEFDWVAQRSPANDFHVGPVAETHFQQPTTHVSIASHGKNSSLATNAQLVEPARFRRLAVITGGKFTTFLHNPHSWRTREAIPSASILLSAHHVIVVETQFQRPIFGYLYEIYNRNARGAGIIVLARVAEQVLKRET
jgi:hypothetical protein